MNLKQAMAIERALAACEHPYTGQLYSFGSWCNVCGAIKLAAESKWTVPHWRDLLVSSGHDLASDQERCDRERQQQQTAHEPARAADLKQRG